MRSIKDLTISKQLFEGLFRFDLEGKLVPALASAVSLSQDATCYTFTLREAYWSDHTLITAHDFVRSLQELFEPSFPSDYASMLFMIKNAKLAKMGRCCIEDVGVYALDNKTLVIDLVQKVPYFLELTAFPTFFPVPSKADVYSGPFTLKRMDPEFALVIKKNEAYWDKDQVALDQIYFSMITDHCTEALLFEEGELDWLGQPLSHALSTELLAQMKEASSYSILGSCWLVFNTDQFPLNQPKLRRALSIAIKRQELIAHILQGGQEVAYSPIPSSMNLSKNTYYNDGDIKEAKELLQASKMDSGSKLSLLFPSTNRARQLAQTIQSQWQQGLGVEVRLELVEPHVYRQRVKEGDFMISYGQWVADFADPVAFLDLFRLPRSSGLNTTNWQSTVYKELLEQADAESCPIKRKNLLATAEKLLIEEMPIAPLYHYAFDYAKKEYVSDVALSPLGIADFKYAKIRF